MNFEGPVCGMTWGWVGSHEEWNSQSSQESLQALSRINVNWVTIAFQALQDTPQSTTIDYRDASLVNDEDVTRAIRQAKSMGLKVCLKPVVNCRNGSWRGFISFFDEDVPGEPNWGDWFASYREYLVHYAKIAQREEVELFCVGCELVMTDKQDSHWRATIAEVRKHYSGPITYNCDKYQEDRLGWWDAVDVISSSGYYPLGQWDEHLARIEKVVKQHQKPFLFLEAGCPSRTTSPARPNDWTMEGPADGEAQLGFYREMLSAFERPWMLGFMLWDWPATLYPLGEAENNRDYCIYGKPAEKLTASIYSQVQERSQFK
jgi:hypothetical protein